MIVRDKDNKDYLGIGCDAPGCEVMAPPAAEILKGHGLVNMGWECHGGVHFCPTHANKEIKK